MRSYSFLVLSVLAPLSLGANACTTSTEDPPSEESSSSSTASSSDGADGSTTQVADGGSSSDSGESSSSGEPPEPEPSCSEVSCGIECSVPAEREDNRGNACECESSTQLEGTFDCDLPEIPCSKFDDLCFIQALRWGVVGQYPHELQIPDVGGFNGTIEVLEPGLAHRLVNEHDEFQCCNGEQSNSLTHGDYPRMLPPPTDPGWFDCFVEPIEGSAFSVCASWAMDADLGSCTDAPVAECPEAPLPPPPDAPCEQVCPMANDGVCDEPGGSGLCPAGCDPIDCTCEEDVPGQCDETTEGGPCAIGSDPDFCQPFG